MKRVLKQIPKVELHVHLDGSVRIETACELLGKNVSEQMMADKNENDLNKYLEKFLIPLKLLQTSKNLERVSEELALDLKKDNIIYAEIRLEPMKHLENGLTLEEVVDAVLKGLGKVELKTNLILCITNKEKEEINENVIYLAKKYLGKGVSAIELVGSKSLYNREDYENTFLLAKKLGIPVTIDVDYEDGITSIQRAIDFGTERLGNGIRCIESKKILQKIIDEEIVLELCPTSNMDTNIFEEYNKHVIKELYELGIGVTINTDNRTVSNITLTEEYQKLVDAFGFTIEDFLICNLNAVDASFLSEMEKQELRERLKNQYKDFLIK